MEETIELRSPYKQQKEAKELQIYERFLELMKVKGAQVLEVHKVLMTEFNIHSSTTIWALRKRVKERLRAEKSVK